MVSGLDAAVVDISSDEEVEMPEDFIDAFLGVGKEWADDFIDGILPPDHGAANHTSFKGESKSKDSLAGAKHSSGRSDGDDDDCVVLDGDPDCHSSEVNNVKGCVNESEDLQIVGEKGQLACRDYPHPRHLCANFPFSTSPHERFCRMCHCYVCDSHAPCKYWGNGIAVSDHCHSTEKEGRWRRARKCFKERNMPGQPIKSPYTILPGNLPFQKPQHIREQVPLSRPHPLQVCSANHLPHPSVTTMGRLAVSLAGSQPTTHRLVQQIRKQHTLLSSVSNVGNIRHAIPHGMPVTLDNSRFKRHGIPGSALLSSMQNAQRERRAYFHPVAPIHNKSRNQWIRTPVPDLAKLHAGCTWDSVPDRPADMQVLQHTSATSTGNYRPADTQVLQHTSVTSTGNYRPADTQVLQHTSVASTENDSTRSLKHVLAKVAAELGVAEDYRSTLNTQSHISPSTNLGQNNVDRSIPAEQMGYVVFDNTLSNHTEPTSFIGNGHTEQPLNTAICESNPVIRGIGPMACPSNLEQQGPLGSASQLVPLCDLNSSWSTLSQV